MKKIIALALVFICSLGLIAYSKASSNLKTDEPKQKTVELKENRYEVAGINNPVEFEKTFKTIKELVADGNKEKVENYILYPLRVHSDKEKITIETKEDFIKKYDNIFTDKVKSALKNQKIKDTFVNYQGVMVGNGEIWFGTSDSKYGIITVNK